MEEWEFVSDEDEENVSEDYDLIVSELFLEWSGDEVSAHVGKINPAFGIAWDVAPGLYGADFAGDYEVAGQLGAGVVVPLGGDEESVAFSFDLFKEDTTALSSCVMDDRCARTREDDGAPRTPRAPRRSASPWAPSRCRSWGGWDSRRAFCVGPEATWTPRTSWVWLWR